jgi:hypothetical protein
MFFFDHVRYGQEDWHRRIGDGQANTSLAMAVASTAMRTVKPYCFLNRQSLMAVDDGDALFSPWRLTIARRLVSTTATSGV